MIRLASLFEIDAIWPHIAEGMRDCCERFTDDLTPDWVLGGCRQGNLFLFVFEEDAKGYTGKHILGALVARAETRQGKRALCILALCGFDMGKWIGDLRTHSWPAQMGFAKIVFEGRKGLGRVIPEAREIRRVFELDLSNG